MPRTFPFFLAILAVAASAAGATVEPLPPPQPPADTVVILAHHALDGQGGELHDVKIGVTKGRIDTLASTSKAAPIDLRRFTVLPGWIDVHVHLDSRRVVFVMRGGAVYKWPGASSSGF